MPDDTQKTNESSSTKTDVENRPTSSGQMAMLPCNLGNFNFSGNLAENWKQWYQKFKIYLVASNLDNESDSRKIALLLHNLGDKCIEIYNSFNLTADENKQYEVVVDKFQRHFSPKKNLTVLRHKFLNRKQASAETIDNFYTDLVNLSLACELKDVRESLLCDVLVSG